MRSAVFIFIIIMSLVEESRVRSQDIKVQGRVVTLACPYSTGDYSWKGSKNVTGDKEQYLTVTATQGQELFEGEFSCVNNDGVEHWFYFSVKVCDGCYEFDGLFAMGVIFGDLLLTGAVILIVFLCARKQTHSTPTHTQQRATNTRIMNPPRPPNPDYEALDPRTAHSALYAGINKN